MAILARSGAQATEFTPPSSDACSSLAAKKPSWAFHTRTLPSKEPDATNTPQRVKLMALTV
eukprot:CAMPEP_0178389774 /NCGR_PEP_ID=MMETSP0689_2-20121128/10299_1 /TAXON_ID=160604 /ORGANISM="Amphidinium massartii, Strain CS-259" /LENGTH=60 /DNA_ID=CAMNT_0020010253 /DNA_START=736 /DNA_END=918 /DNA_ORIENTATION=-